MYLSKVNMSLLVITSYFHTYIPTTLVYLPSVDSRLSRTETRTVGVLHTATTSSINWYIRSCYSKSSTFFQWCPSSFFTSEWRT